MTIPLGFLLSLILDEQGRRQALPGAPPPALLSYGAWLAVRAVVGRKMIELRRRDPSVDKPLLWTFQTHGIRRKHCVYLNDAKTRQLLCLALRSRMSVAQYPRRDRGGGGVGRCRVRRRRDGGDGHYGRCMRLTLAEHIRSAIAHLPAREWPSSVPRLI